MPTTTPTATGYSVSEIMRGPSDLWLGVANPSSGVLMVDPATGTPDAGANPDAICVGLLKEGAKMTIKFTKDDERADQLPAPYRSTITGDDARIDAVILQLDNFDILQLITSNGTYSSGTGYEKISFGGRKDLPSLPAAVIAKKPSGTNLYQIFHLYAAINEAGLEFTWNDKGRAESPIQLVGQAVLGRARGDMVGYFGATLATS